MGNRAVITTSQKDIGVYLHWNGGRDSIEAFLLYCKLKGYRSPDKDCYGWARLCQVIGNFFGGDLSIGIDRFEILDTDNGDNGVYVIRDWEIIDRLYAPSNEQMNYDLLTMVLDINDRQPVTEQLDKKVIEDEVNKLVRPITQTQIKAIHAIKSTLGFTDARYRKLLESIFGKKSCKDLTKNEASIMIEVLNKIKG